jgi:membrane-anchored protein YejM (alkaline phosphatase superfamily)
VPEQGYQPPAASPVRQDHLALANWCAWFYILNIFLFLVIGYQYLTIILKGIGSLKLPTSLNELDTSQPGFYLYLFFIIFAFTSYIVLYLLIPAVISLIFICLVKHKWTSILISFISLFLTAVYLIADSKVYELYRYHLNTTILQMIMSNEIAGVFDFSWLEWLYISLIMACLILTECVFAIFAWKYLANRDYKRWAGSILLVSLFIYLLSLQIFFYSGNYFIYGRTIGFILLSSAVICLFGSWQHIVKKFPHQYRLSASSIPVICLLISFILTTYAARLNHFQLLSMIIILSVIAAMLLLHNNRKPVAILLGCCLFTAYEIFALGYAATMRQVIETSYILPFYSKLGASVLPGAKGETSIYRTSEGLFIQPDGFNTKLQYPLHELRNKPASHPYNILFIVIDTWRFDSLTADVTPNIFNFSKKSLVYTNHWSGGNSTQPGMFSLFYGLPGHYWSPMLKQGKGPVLIHELLKNHYQTGVFSSSELVMPALNKTIFLDIPDLKLSAPGNSIIERDQNVNLEFASFIENTEKSNRPFFGVLFYDGAHGFCADGNSIHKFKPESAACGRFALSNTTDPTYLRNRYWNALYKIDALIGNILANLDKHALLEKTIIVITGDHGEEFNDNHLNYWDHASNFTRYQVQTPFILYWPGRRHQVISKKTSHFDIVPTLMLNALNYINSVADYSIGRNLFVSNPEPAYLIVDSYNNEAIVENDRITTILPDGEFEVRDSHYIPLPGARLHVEIIKQAMHDMMKFLTGAEGNKSIH